MLNSAFLSDFSSLSFLIILKSILVHSVQADLGAFGLLILWACIPSKEEAVLKILMFLPVELI